MMHLKEVEAREDVSVEELLKREGEMNGDNAKKAKQRVVFGLFVYVE